MIGGASLDKLVIAGERSTQDIRDVWYLIGNKTESFKRKIK